MIVKLYNRRGLWLILDGIVIISTFVIMIMAIVRDVPEQQIDPQKVHILKKDSSLSYFANNPVSHNLNLVKVNQEKLAMDANDGIANRAVQMQIRLFYSAILAGLSSLLFQDKVNSKHIIRITLLFLIVMMYLLEVHLNDLSDRQKSAYYIKDSAIDSLIHLRPNDSSWFVFKSDEFKHAWDSVSAPCKRIQRKLKSARCPNPEQFVFFIVPYIAIHFSWYMLQKKKNGKIKKSISNAK